MTTDLTTEQKQQILTDGFNDCMKHHTCGNYISMSDVEGLESSDIEWYVNTDSLQMVAITEFGTYHHQYDYDFSFDSNLNTFVEGLQEFLTNEVNNRQDIGDLVPPCQFLKEEKLKSLQFNFNVLFY